MRTKEEKQKWYARFTDDRLTSELQSQCNFFMVNYASKGNNAMVEDTRETMDLLVAEVKRRLKDGERHRQAHIKRIFESKIAS